MRSSPTGDYRHVVLFKFKDSAGESEVEAIEDAFVRLAAKLDMVKDFEWGTNLSPEGLAGGLTHCFLVTFADRKALEEYLPHPEHRAFVEILEPRLDKVTVFDYVAG